jgi:hypothetical protein
VKVFSLFLFFVLGLNLVSMHVLAQETVEVQLSPDELPNESVTPKLDSPSAVRNRIINFKNRFELVVNQGFLLDEPFYKNTYRGLEVIYNFNEISALGVKYQVHDKGISNYSEQFKETSQVRYDLAPQPTSTLALSYHYRMMYGKLSFSQNSVWQSALLSGVEVNSTKYEKVSSTGGGVFLSQKNYFAKHWSIGLTYMFRAMQILDPNTISLVNKTTVDEKDFNKKFEVGHSLDLSLSYLF